MFSRFLERLDILWHWKSWPWEILYFPVTLYVVMVGLIRSGHVFYFAAANPKLPLAGFAGESKHEIIQRIPKEWKPKTLYVTNQDTLDELAPKISDLNMSYPLFVKPDVGEGGYLATKVDSWEDLKVYHESHAMNYLVQDFVQHELEVSVLVHKAMGSLQISSITERSHLKLVGNGTSTVRDLLKGIPFIRHRLSNILAKCQSYADLVLLDGQVWEPTSLGNLDYGSAYYDITNQSIPLFRNVLESINDQVDLFDYARYDLKSASREDLFNGKFQILEINGVKGLPIHIYESRCSFWNGQREIFKHWGYVLTLSQRNQKQGAKVPGFRQGLAYLIHHQRTLQLSLNPRIC